MSDVKDYLFGDAERELQRAAGLLREPSGPEPATAQAAGGKRDEEAAPSDTAGDSLPCSGAA